MTARRPALRPASGPSEARIAWRAVRAAVLTGRHAAAHGLSLLWPGKRTAGPERLRRLLEQLGGVYLKLGQLLSLQPDIVPRAYCDALFDLLDRVPPFSASEVRRVFEEELGRAPSQALAAFEAEPFAAASVAQVHRAELRGRPLAVKVQRPDVARSFAPDLELLRILERRVRRSGPRHLQWVARSIRELDRWTTEELDFRHEARAMAAVAWDARGRGGERVPEVVEPLSGRRVLVAELLQGPTVLDLLRRLENSHRTGARDPVLEGVDLAAVAGHLVDNFADSAFRRGLFHADLHPANLLVLPGSALGYVDFGITGRLSRHSRRRLLSMTLALTRGDAGALVRAFLGIAIVEPGGDPRAFRRGLERRMDEWMEPEDDGGDPYARGNAGRDRGRRIRRSFTRVMLDLLQLSRETGLWPAPEVLRYIRSVISADGLIQRFAPGFDVTARLEESCLRLLEEEGLWSEASAAAVADGGAAALRLADTAFEAGPAAWPLLRGLDRASALTAEPELEDTGLRRGPTRRRAVQLALAVAGFALVASRLGAEPRWGWNLFTAAVGAATAAALYLLGTLLRLARRGPREPPGGEP